MAISKVRSLVHDSQGYIRAAADSILVDLEDFAWLERELLSGISENQCQRLEFIDIQC